MKLAVVAGGWHWPLDFFRKISAEAAGADLFVIAHRSPELPIVRQEKRAILESAVGSLADIDRRLYSEFPTIDGLRSLGWEYSEAPNTVGDWGFFKQWLERHDYRQYDVILNCHDDTYVRRFGLFDWLAHQRGWLQTWLLCANGYYPQAPAGYVRGSFEFWKPELLDMLGGRIDLGDIRLTREGLTNSPEGLSALSAWNDICVPLRDFMVGKGIENRIAYLSQYYRVGPWVIEGERGFMHFREGAPWSFDAGLEAYPISEGLI